MHLMNSLPEINFFSSLKSLDLSAAPEPSAYNDTRLLPTALFARSDSVQFRMMSTHAQRCVPSIRDHIPPSTIRHLDLNNINLYTTALFALTDVIAAHHETLQSVALSVIPSRHTWVQFQHCLNLRELVLGRKVSKGQSHHNEHWGTQITPNMSIPSLEKLIVKGTALEDTVIVMVVMHFGFPNLRYASFTFPSSLNTSADVTWPTPLLRHLSATALRLQHLHFDASALPLRVAEWRLNAEAVSAIFMANTIVHCKQLEHVHLELGPLAGLRLDSWSGALMAAAWPSLKHLHLSSIWTSNEANAILNFSKVRIADLAEFAAECPLIEFINIPLEEKDDGVVTDTSTPLTRVHALLPLRPILATLNLVAPLPQITHPTKVVDFFRLIFPDLRVIVLPTRKEADNDEAMLQWERVQVQLAHRWELFENPAAPERSAQEKAAFDYEDDAGYLPPLDLGNEDDESEVGSPDSSDNE